MYIHNQNYFNIQCYLFQLFSGNYEWAFCLFISKIDFLYISPLVSGSLDRLRMTRQNYSQLEKKCQRLLCFLIFLIPYSMQTFNRLPFVTILLNNNNNRKLKTTRMAFIHFVSLLYSLPKIDFVKLSNNLYPRQVKYKQ